jgi:hypothetical protein
VRWDQRPIVTQETEREIRGDKEIEGYCRETERHIGTEKDGETDRNG